MTIRGYFDRNVSDTPQAVFQRWHDGAGWRSRTYAEARERVVRAVALLGELVGCPAEPVRVAIMMENCPDWQILYLAASGTCLTVVPIDPKLRTVEVAHVLADSGAVCIFADARRRDVVEAAVRDLANAPGVVYDLSARLEAVDAAAIAAAERVYASRVPNEGTLASLIYTSGTTGRPKGAMLTHGNFTSNADQTFARVEFFSSDSFFNVLPLFHAFSFTGNFLLSLHAGASILFPRGLRTIAEDMQALRPTVLLAVPLLAEKMYSRIGASISSSPLAGFLLRLPLLRRLVTRRVLARFGGRMRIIGIGGAPTAHATLRGLRSLGLDVLEGYGITECAPGVAYPPLRGYRIGSVGPVLDGMEWRIVNQDPTGAGELLVKGPNVSRGYWNNPEGTAAAFDDEGFYHTGDIVRADPDGFITVCGRTKALIVNREGKNIYPEEIERTLERSPMIADAIVLGYRVGSETGEHVGCIVVPDADAVRAHFGGGEPSREEVASTIREYVHVVCRANLADYKLPRKIEVRFEPLERTSTMKVRRIVYAGMLDE